MIEINLLPETERKGRAKAPGAGAGRSSGMEGFAILALAGLMTVVVATGGLYSRSKIKAAERKVQQRRSELARIESEIQKNQKEAQQIRRMRDVLNNQWELLQALDPPDRLLWSEKMDMLANLMPANVFLSEIGVKENIVEVETQASIANRKKWEANKKQGPKPPVIKKPIITYTLGLKGLTTGSDNVEQFDNVLKFHQALVSYKRADAKGVQRRFMQGFDPNIEFETVRATLYQGFPVNEFSFKLKTKPAAERPAQGKAPAGKGGAAKPGAGKPGAGKPGAGKPGQARPAGGQPAAPKPAAPAQPAPAQPAAEGAPVEAAPAEAAPAEAAVEAATPQEAAPFEIETTEAAPAEAEGADATQVAPAEAEAPEAAGMAPETATPAEPATAEPEA